MTELQPTEIELTAKRKKPVSLSKRKIVALVAVIIVIALAAALTAVLAHQASRTPATIQKPAASEPATAP
jgi:flagellar basal body-associated protein FliL